MTTKTKYEPKIRKEIYRVKNYQMASCIARKLAHDFKPLSFVIFTVEDMVAIMVEYPQSMKYMTKFIRSEAKYHKMVLAPYFK
jgi:hypothetical protein